MDVVARIVENADVLVGNEEDLQKGLGIPGPEVGAESKLDPGVFFGMIDKVIAKHPQVNVVATTLREVHSTRQLNKCWHLRREAPHAYSAERCESTAKRAVDD